MLFFEGLFSLNVLVEILLIVSGFLVPYIYLPKTIIVTSRGVVIKRMLRNTFISYNKICYIRKASISDVAREFKFEGWFLTHIALWAIKQLATIVYDYASRKTYFYVTDLEKTVLIETITGEKYYVSPKNPKHFEKIVKMFTASETLKLADTL